MFGLYIFAAIVGCGLLIFSVAGGGGESDVGADGGAGDDPGAGDGAGTGPGDFVLAFFRPRNLIFFSAAFGVTGTLLTLFGPSSLTPVLSGLMGIGAMVVAHGVFGWLRRHDAAIDVLSDTDLEGAAARVVIPIGPGQPGRVACLVGGRELYVVARLVAGATQRLDVGVEVVIMQMGDGVAEVSPLGTPELPSANP